MDSVDIDVENLFNDGNLDQILPPEDALQPPTLVPGLAERFLNLRFSGGQNRVSWSRHGHVAIISLDGSTVNVHALRSHIKTREWELSSARAIETTFENAVNVTWSPAGVELAVVDARGRVGIYAMTATCLNRLNESRSFLTDDSEELGMPVGIWWLRQDRPRNVISSSTRGADRWVHNTTKAKALGPVYLRAFCTVSKRGVFRLMYQRPGARYNGVSLNLPSVSGTLCSHAAFSPTVEGKILVAIHSINGDLAVYHVQVTWPQDIMTDPASTNQPELMIEMVDNSVSMWAPNEATGHTLPQTNQSDDMSLTHLIIVPTSDLENVVHQAPCIWAVYTSVNNTISAGDAGYLSTSVIRRWSVYPLVRSLHPCFDDIPNKTEAPAVNEDVYEVERLSDIAFAQMISSIELVDSGQMVAVTTADGRTELWNPSTQALVSYEGQTEEVTSLAQFGFAFPPSLDSVMTIVSPNACSLLSISEDGKASLQQAQAPVQATEENLGLADAHQSAAISALVLTFTRSCWSNTNGDDILSCILANYQPQHYPAIIAEFYRTLFHDAEFIHEKLPGSEVERLLSKATVSKLLSFQFGILNSRSISMNSPNEDIRYAALSGVWAWLAINLRYVATAYSIFYREYQASMQPQQSAGQTGPHQLSPSYVDAICSTIHWTLDLFRFIISRIMDIGDRQTNPDFFSDPTFTNNLGDTVGDGSQGLIALLLNCQWSRSFLSAIARAMKAFIESNDRSHHPAIARVVNTIRQYSVSKGMNISTIDKLLDGRHYASNGLREGESMDNSRLAKRQIAMYSSGRVGPEYSGTLRMLLQKVINDPKTGLRETGEIQRLKLWSESPDLNWLLLGFGRQFSMGTDLGLYVSDEPDQRRKLYDVHRKTEITITGSADQPIRRCVRCGSLSGDVDGIDKSWSRSMVVHMAKCVCDAYWMLEPILGKDDG